MRLNLSAGSGRLTRKKEEQKRESWRWRKRGIEEEGVSLMLKPSAEFGQFRESDRNGPVGKFEFEARCVNI